MLLQLIGTATITNINGMTGEITLNAIPDGITGEEVANFFQLIDLKVGPTEDDYMMIEWLNANKVPYVVVATKADKLNTTTRTANFAALSDHPLLNPPYTDEKIPVIMFSAQTGMGKNDILAILSENVK